MCLADCGHMALQFSIYKLKTLISLLIDSDVFYYTFFSVNDGCVKVHNLCICEAVHVLVLTWIFMIFSLCILPRLFYFVRLQF